MNREEALGLIEKNVSTRNLDKHMLAAESCMRRLARRFDEDLELWGLAGLLHDLDYDSTKDDFSMHGIRSAQMLSGSGVSESVINAIKAHAGKKELDSMMEKALYAVDPLTGLIVAAALMHPTKKIENVDTQFVLNRFREKRFAAGVHRDQIMSCESIDMELEEFIGICLDAMKSIGPELGL